MKNKSAPLIVLFYASIFGSVSFSAIDKTSSDSTNQYLRTRFGQLTSEVWRYKHQFKFNDLTPVKNNNPTAKPQPIRNNPGRGVFNKAETKLYVTYQGSELHPGNEIAVIDIEQQKVIKRIKVGSRPYQIVLHPDGRYLVVTNELSNYLTVIDTLSDEAVKQISLDYYGQGIVFSKNGKKAYVAIRYLGQVLSLDMYYENETLSGEVHVIGGFDENIFFGTNKISNELKTELHKRNITDEKINEMLDKRIGGINAILRARCKTCHMQPAGGFVSGIDRELNFLSAVENLIPGKPYKSPLLRAVIPQSLGGFGDIKTTA